MHRTAAGWQSSGPHHPSSHIAPHRSGRTGDARGSPPEGRVAVVGVVEGLDGGGPLDEAGQGPERSVRKNRLSKMSLKCSTTALRQGSPNGISRTRTPSARQVCTGRRDGVPGRRYGLLVVELGDLGHSQAAPEAGESSADLVLFLARQDLDARPPSSHVQAVERVEGDPPSRWRVPPGRSDGLCLVWGARGRLGRGFPWGRTGSGLGASAPPPGGGSGRSSTPRAAGCRASQVPTRWPPHPPGPRDCP
jgi:hypothetical protein